MNITFSCFRSALARRKRPVLWEWPQCGTGYEFEYFSGLELYSEQLEKRKRGEML
jgi:hypothetical protein